MLPSLINESSCCIICLYSSIEHFPTHSCSKWPPQHVTFQGYWFLFLKALRFEKKQPSWLSQCSPSLHVCRTEMTGSWGGLHVKWISVRHSPHNGWKDKWSCNSEAPLFESPPSSRWKTTITHFAKQVADSFNVEDPFSLWSGYKESLINSLHISSQFFLTVSIHENKSQGRDDTSSSVSYNCVLRDS